MIWIDVHAVYVLGAMPSEVRTAYEKWVVAFPAKAGRLEELVGQVVADFRGGLGANPNMVLEDGDDLLPERCIADIDRAALVKMGDQVRQRILDGALTGWERPGYFPKLALILGVTEFNRFVDEYNGAKKP